MFLGWEGGRRSGNTLAMHHRLSGLSIYELKGLCDRNDHPAYALIREYGTIIIIVVAY